MNLRRYRSLGELTRGQRRRYAAAVLAMGLSHVVLFAVPLISKTALDGILGPGPAGDGAGTLFARLTAAHSAAFALGAALVAITGLTAAGGALQYLRARWASLASEAIVRGLRDRLYGHLGRLPCVYLDRADTGDLVQRCTSDVETIRVFLTGQVVEIGRTVLLLATVIPVLLWLDVKMTLVSVALFPVIFAFALVFFRKVQGLFLNADEAEAEMTGVLQDNLAGIRVVRAFARQKFERAKFARSNALFRDRTQRLIRFLGVYWSVSEVLCMTQAGATLLFGARSAAAGDITVGTLFAFLSYQAIVIWPVRQLGRVLTDTGKALVSLGRVGEILDESPEVVLGEGAGAGPEPLRGGIEFEGVTFAHGESGVVLEDLSFRVKPGETLALLGPPGSGKSTIVQLLLRLYEYEHGSVRLDGRELRGLPRRFVRSRIGVVLQQPFLYSRTVEANVRVGRVDATREEIEDSAGAACIHGAIERFAEGYDTLLGERGVTLSGGQRQRLAIARAILKDPAILVLDDALSAVDTETEARILEALRRRRHRRTTILIAHRLSSVGHADRILILERGRIVQSGTHRELIREPGPYARLWRIQHAVEEEIELDLEVAE